MDTGKTRTDSCHEIQHGGESRIGGVLSDVCFSLAALCSVLVDLLAVAANWIEDPCK